MDGSAIKIKDGCTMLFGNQQQQSPLHLPWWIDARGKMDVPAEGPAAWPLDSVVGLPQCGDVVRRLMCYDKWDYPRSCLAAAEVLPRMAGYQTRRPTTARQSIRRRQHCHQCSGHRCCAVSELGIEEKKR